MKNRTSGEKIVEIRGHHVGFRRRGRSAIRATRSGASID
jgi:hypothetical protein